MAKQLALPGGLPARHLRLTLANLGNLGAEDRAKVHSIVSHIAGEHWPTPVHIQGLVRRRKTANAESEEEHQDEDLQDAAAAIGNEPDYDTVYATAGHPALQAMYQRMGAELNDAGLRFSQNPGEPPKVELGSVNIGAQPPADWANGPEPSWTANALRVHEGSAQTDYPLSGKPQKNQQPLARGEVWLANSEPEQEQRIVYGAVLVPDLPDSWGHSISKAEIEKAAHRYVENGTILGLGPHTPEMPGEINRDIQLLESYVAPQDVHLGGKRVPQGSWVIAARVPENVWEDIKERKLQSFSLWGTGDVVEEPDVVDAVSVRTV